VVFQKAIEKAEVADEVAARVNNLIDCITYSVFMYTTRGLFECDKHIFTSQMAFQVNTIISINLLYYRNFLYVPIGKMATKVAHFCFWPASNQTGPCIGIFSTSIIFRFF